MIMKKIKEAGFKISAHKEVTLNKELASMFYKEHEGKEFFDSLTNFMARFSFSFKSFFHFCFYIFINSKLFTYLYFWFRYNIKV